MASIITKKVRGRLYFCAIGAYRGQYHVEHAFRDMKSHEFISLSPMYHWTDHNIKIYALYCVLAYTYLCLLHRRVQQTGIYTS